LQTNSAKERKKRRNPSEFEQKKGGAARRELVLCFKRNLVSPACREGDATRRVVHYV